MVGTGQFLRNEVGRDGAIRITHRECDQFSILLISFPVPVRRGPISGWANNYRKQVIRLIDRQSCCRIDNDRSIEVFMIIVL